MIVQEQLESLGAAWLDIGMFGRIVEETWFRITAVEDLYDELDEAK